MVSEICLLMSSSFMEDMDRRDRVFQWDMQSNNTREWCDL
jgi:hypothetical protein